MDIGIDGYRYGYRYRYVGHIIDHCGKITLCPRNKCTTQKDTSVTLAFVY